MEKKSRRAPGRSKAQTKEAASDNVVMDTPVVPKEVIMEELDKPEPPQVKTPKPAAKKPKIKQRVQENTSHVYEALTNKGPAFMLMSRKLSVYDKESDSIRMARYCPNENSIWMDEQSDVSKSAPIVFRDGFLTVTREQPNLKRFLDIHPSNEANGGTAFKIIDTKVDKEKVVEREFAVFDAISLVKNSDVNDLLAVALFFQVSIDRPMTEIKHDLLMIAKKSPESFVRSFDDPVVKCKATIRQALDYQILKASRDSMRWFDSNGIIVSVPHGQDPIDVTSRFCLTEKGASVLATLEDQLERLA
jgi:hypothetical protein